MSDPFESIRRLQEQLNQIQRPFKQYQEQMELISKAMSPALLEHQRMFSEIAQSTAMTSAIQNALSIQQSFNPIIESLNRQRELTMNLNLPITLFKQFDQVYSSIGRVLSSTHLDTLAVNLPDMQPLLHEAVEKAETLMDDYELDIPEVESDIENEPSNEELKNSFAFLKDLSGLLFILITAVSMYPDLKNGVIEILNDLDYVIELMNLK